MENPRTRTPGEWAPPPPVVVAPPVEQAPSPPLRPEDEFEATLGSLVEHFATLPPPSFGEAPELAAAPARETRPVRRRSPAVVWVSSLVLGATVAGGVMLGLHFAKPEKTAREAPPPAVAPAPPAPKIVVKSLPEDPPPATETTAPLADETPTPAAAEHAAEPAEAAKAAPPDRKPRKTTIRKRTRNRPAGSAGPALPASTAGDGWEDPYK
jgi:hypothetical protein